MRFDRFQDLALYDAEAGYYASSATRLGAAGDFYTAPHVHPLFGRTIAQRILAEYRRLGRPASFRVVEVGPGDGRLATDVAAGVAAGLGEGERMDYVLVERSAALRARTLERLAALDLPTIEWRVAEGLGADGPFRGVVLANELLDALPVRRFVWRAGSWRELAVAVDGRPFRWSEGEAIPSGSGAPSTPGPREGAIAEVGPYAEAFVREVGDHLAGGAALLLDYGADEEELVRGHPAGTLAAWRAHREVADPLAEPGEVDLSAFVNFTRIRAAATASGLVEVAYRPQAEALEAWGLARLVGAELAALPDETSRVRLRLAVKNLVFGFGTFQVLELRSRQPEADVPPLSAESPTPLR